MVHVRSERVGRRLAAIMAADVAGYSRLMELDELGTAQTLQGHRVACDALVNQYGGRIVKTTGDGLLLEFASVVDAVECAVAVQATMTERNRHVPFDRRMLFRIGINLGDILIQGDDILGDGVNIAARLETIAEPGGICISSSAYDEVRGKVSIEFADLGEQSLKNIARPIRAYSVVSDAIPLHGTRASPRAAPHLSIVVLPFENIGGDPEQNYFVDGVTDSLTTDLSRINGSFVIARNTAFAFKGKAADVKQIGRELNVRYVLEGSVQRSGNRLRVNVQLIDAETTKHLWADRFDKSVVDLFDIHDEIVSRLANALSAQLVEAEARHAERSSHPDATDLIFQGWAWFNKGMASENLAQAQDFYRRALALDPTNIDGMVGIAGIDALVAAFAMTDEPAARFASAEIALIKVLSMNPHSAIAHTILGGIQIFTNRAARAIGECEQALLLDRNLATAHAMIGYAKYYCGHAEETESHIQEALRLSPRDPMAFVWMSNVGGAKLQLGADAEAVLWFRRCIETNRNHPLANFFLGASLALLGEMEEGRSAVKTGLALNPAFSIRRLRASVQNDNARFVAGRERVIDAMRMVGVPEG
jgi:TolB-like protein/class 3 adenylate cyclase/Flp pilus assembly protein TadD